MQTGHPMTLTNCTVSGNTAKFRGGGISDYSTSPMTLTNVSLSGNRSTTGFNGNAFAGGVFAWTYKSQAADVIMRNTIVAGNYSGASPGTTPGDLSGPVNSKSANNLIGDGDHLSGLSNGSQGNQIGSAAAGTVINAKLGALGNNGGPTATMASSRGVRRSPQAAWPWPLTRTRGSR